MKAKQILFVLLSFSKILSTQAQHSDLTEFCSKVLEKINFTDKVISFSDVETIKYLKQIKSSQAKGKKNGNWNINYEDFAFENKSDKEEFNSLSEETTEYEYSKHVNFLERAKASFVAHQTVDLCINKIFEQKPDEIESYMTAEMGSNYFDIYIWPNAKGNVILKLEQLDIIPPRPVTKDIKNSNITLMKPLNHGQAIHNRYLLNNNKCGEVVIIYKLNNMGTSKTIQLKIEKTKPFTDLYNGEILNFGDVIPRLNNFESNNDFAISTVTFSLNDLKTKLIGNFNIKIWNPDIKSEYREINSKIELLNIRNENLYTKYINNILIMDNQEKVIIKGNMSTNDDPGLKLAPRKGKNGQFVELIQNDKLNPFGTFTLYVDNAYAGIKYQPSANVFEALGLRIGNICDE